MGRDRRARQRGQSQRARSCELAELESGRIHLGTAGANVEIAVRAYGHRIQKLIAQPWCVLSDYALGCDPCDGIAIRKPQVAVRTRDDLARVAAGVGRRLIFRDDAGCRDSPHLVRAAFCEPLIVYNRA